MTIVIVVFTINILSKHLDNLITKGMDYVMLGVISKVTPHPYLTIY